MDKASGHSSHDTFRRRIRRIDPTYHQAQSRTRDTRAQRPLGAVLLGFAWAYLVIAISQGRETLASSLQQGSLPPEYHDYIFMALAGLLFASIVMLGVHAMRFFFRSRARRGHSGPLLVGVLGAVMLAYTPTAVWHTGFDMIDDTSRGMIRTASSSVADSLPGVDFGGATFVSSRGQ